MTEIRHTDVKDFFQKSCQSTPSHLRRQPLVKGRHPLPSPSPGDLSQATGLLLNK